MLSSDIAGYNGRLPAQLSALGHVLIYAATAEDAAKGQPAPKQTNGLIGSAAAASASASAGLAPAVSRR